MQCLQRFKYRCTEFLRKVWKSDTIAPFNNNWTTATTIRFLTPFSGRHDFNETIKKNIIMVFRTPDIIDHGYSSFCSEPWNKNLVAFTTNPSQKWTKYRKSVAIGTVFVFIYLLKIQPGTSSLHHKRNLQTFIVNSKNYCKGMAAILYSGDR